MRLAAGDPDELVHHVDIGDLGDVGESTGLDGEQGRDHRLGQRVLGSTDGEVALDGDPSAHGDGVGAVGGDGVGRGFGRVEHDDAMLGRQGHHRTSLGRSRGGR